ncbi:MAG: Na+/H+ antiporter family protein [Turicibacter sp.]
MNAVLVAVITMISLSLLRFHVVFSLLIASIVGGLVGGLSLSATIGALQEGLGGSAEIALSYILLGSFAVGIVRTGLPKLFLKKVTSYLKENSEKKTFSKWLLLLSLVLVAISSQNIIPIHIAFIPILVPTLLQIMNELSMDRRAVSCALTFGLITPYMWIPAGFGLIYFNILNENMQLNGITVDYAMIQKALTLPALGLVIGLLVALLVTYRKKREYSSEMNLIQDEVTAVYSRKTIVVGIISILATILSQLLLESMVFSALFGITILQIGGVFKVRDNAKIMDEGIKMMASIGFVMVVAAGFSNVLRATGDIEALVQGSLMLIGNNKLIAAALMLLIGLFVTVGIGSSFSTIPILASLFVPLCSALGFSPLATLAIIGTAGALGDAGSPASDSTLGPTSGLNADGQHNHIYDTCIPTFLHFNIPLFIFGVIAAMVL